MTRFALVDPSRQNVAQVATAKFPVASPLTWIDVSARPEDDATLEHMLYVNGQFVAPPPEPELGPVVVSPRQARLALLQAGLLDRVNELVQQAGQEAEITWDFSTQIERDNPLINYMATHLGLTAQQVDELFAKAATL